MTKSLGVLLPNKHFGIALGASRRSQHRPKQGAYIRHGHPEKGWKGTSSPAARSRGQCSVMDDARRRARQAQQGRKPGEGRAPGRAQGIRIRRMGTKEFLPGLKGTQRLTHDMSPHQQDATQGPPTCSLSSALLVALRRLKDPSGRQLAADICHMGPKGPAKHTQRAPATPNNDEPSRKGHTPGGGRHRRSS